MDGSPHLATAEDIRSMRPNLRTRATLLGLTLLAGILAVPAATAGLVKTDCTAIANLEPATAATECYVQSEGGSPLPTIADAPPVAPASLIGSGTTTITSTVASSPLPTTLPSPSVGPLPFPDATLPTIPAWPDLGVEPDPGDVSVTATVTVDGRAMGDSQRTNPPIIVIVCPDCHDDDLRALPINVIVYRTQVTKETLREILRVETIRTSDRSRDASQQTSVVRETLIRDAANVAPVPPQGTQDEERDTLAPRDAGSQVHDQRAAKTPSDRLTWWLSGLLGLGLCGAVGWIVWARVRRWAPGPRQAQAGDDDGPAAGAPASGPYRVPPAAHARTTEGGARPRPST